MLGSGFFSILFIAIGLSADCFAVALSGGISGINHSSLRVLRVALSFGLFQASMTVLGWLAGKTIVELIADYDHWVAFILLALVSGRMLWGSLRSGHSREKAIDITAGLPLLILSLATSIDALAVGLSFAFLDIHVAGASLTIGAIAFLVTSVGFMVGRSASKAIGRRAEAFGGIILLAIAFKILLEHLL